MQHLTRSAARCFSGVSSLASFSHRVCDSQPWKIKLVMKTVSLSLLGLTTARSFIIRSVEILARAVFELPLAELKRSNVSVAADESGDTAQRGACVRFLGGKSFWEEFCFKKGIQCYYSSPLSFPLLLQASVLASSFFFFKCGPNWICVWMALT